MKTYLTTIISFLSFTTNKGYSPVVSNNGLLSHEVFFNADSHTITNKEYVKLLKFIKTIKTIAIDNVSVHGFCDDNGGTYNHSLKLSNKRANAIETIITKYITINKGELDSSIQEKNLFQQLCSLNQKVVVVVSPKENKI